MNLLLDPQFLSTGKDIATLMKSDKPSFQAKKAL